MDFANGIALVVFSGEQRFELERIECSRQRFRATADFVLDGIVLFFARELVQRLDVGQALFELVDALDVVAYP